MSAAASDAVTEVVRIGWSLSHPLRVRILAALLESGPAAPAELAERLGAELPATSHHCRALQEARMIELAREGRSQPSKRYVVAPGYRGELERLLRDVCSVVGAEPGASGRRRARDAVRG